VMFINILQNFRYTGSVSAVVHADQLLGHHGLIIRGCFMHGNMWHAQCALDDMTRTLSSLGMCLSTRAIRIGWPCLSTPWKGWACSSHELKC
jgi:hypothetical protein